MTDSKPDPNALQPSSLSCFGCGLSNAAGLQIRFYNDGYGACKAVTQLDERHQGFPGMAHGGVIATILDEALSRTGMTEDFRRLLFTARLELRYKKPVPLHTIITVRARLEKDRGMVVYAVGEILLPGGEIAAEANAVLMPVPPEKLGAMDTDEAGWRVYPEQGNA
jgi:acyl-coenzyme A thioesterase PaaI-like protein